MYNIKLITCKATMCSLYNVHGMDDRWVEAAGSSGFRNAAVWIVLQVENGFSMNFAVQLHIGDLIIRGVLVIFF